MAKIIDHKEYSKIKKTLKLECQCGWSGLVKDAWKDLHPTLMDFECPKCQKMLLIVNMLK